MMGANDDVIIEVKNLKMHFPQPGGMFFGRGKGIIYAVDGLSFSIRKGETLGLVGEKGCGKSTTGRAILQLCKPTAGEVLFEGTDLCHLGGEKMRKMRRKMQMIFQDPYASLNPRMTVGDVIAEPLDIHGIGKGKDRRERVQELMRTVGLNPHFITCYPREFSGGQRQRISIARALAVEPAFIVCDEPISALDASIHAQVIDLLEDLQDRLNLTYLFIAHDFGVARHISNRVAVMHLGKMVELADRDDLYNRPLHPHTKALLSAGPIRNQTAEDVSSPANYTPGCRFESRCSMANEKCREERPEIRMVADNHWVACHSVD